MPDHPLVAQTLRRLPARGDGRRRLAARCCAGIEAGDDRGGRARPAGALAARGRGAERAALRVPRRRAARGAPHAGGADPALCRPGQRRRSRPARPRRDRQRARGGLAAARATPTRCTRRWCALGVVTDGRGGGDRKAGQRWLEQLARRPARATRLRVATQRARAELVGRGRTAAAAARCCYPDAAIDPVIAAADGMRRRWPRWTRDEALRELLRARLGGLGPARADDLAAAARACRAPTSSVALARAAGAKATCCKAASRRGHAEGTTSGASGICWRASTATRSSACGARSSRSSRATSCASCSTGSTSAPASRVSGPDALAGVLGAARRLRGAGGAWEAEMLPARVERLSTRLARRPVHRRPHAVDAAAPRRAADGRAAAPRRCARRRSLLLPRRRAALWTRLAPPPATTTPASARARAASPTTCAAHGASFFDEIADGARLLRSRARGRARRAGRRAAACNCDSFAGLRALLVPAAKRARRSARRRRGAALFGIEDAGRWALVRHAEPVERRRRRASKPPRRAGRSPRRSSTSRASCCAATASSAGACSSARPAWLPPWRDLVRVYRRLEARGEIRGGRFIAGLSGEQFALPEAIALMREVRRRPLDGALVCLAAADPAEPARHRAAGPEGAARGRRARALSRRRAGREPGRRAGRMARAG